MLQQNKQEEVAEQTTCSRLGDNREDRQEKLVPSTTQAYKELDIHWRSTDEEAWSDFHLEKKSQHRTMGRRRQARK